MRTNAGTDWQTSILGNAAAAGAGTGTSRAADYLGLSASTTPPAAGDTTLSGEITTPGGGLVRAQGTYAHTTGVASYTITHTFTANASDVLPVTISKYGVFNAAAAGTMAFESLFAQTATLTAPGDQATATITVAI